MWLKASLQSMADLDESWLRQQSRTSDAGALEPYKNRKVRHYTMGTTGLT